MVDSEVYLRAAELADQQLPAYDQINDRLFDSFIDLMLDPDRLSFANNDRVIALCFMAAIAKSEGR